MCNAEVKRVLIIRSVLHVNETCTKHYIIMEALMNPITIHTFFPRCVF